MSNTMLISSLYISIVQQYNAPMGKVWSTLKSQVKKIKTNQDVI